MSFRIALVGPDGTGKTTIARRLVAELPWPAQYIYMGVNQGASNVMLPTTWLALKVKRLVGKKVSMGGPPPIVVQRKRGWRGLLSGMKSFARTANLMADEWFRQLVCWWAERRGKIVVMDRHFFFDYFAHDVQPRYGARGFASRIHGWMLRHMYPRPHFVIHLDGDAQVLFDRKREGTVQQLQRRREEYAAARALFPDSVVIDTSQSMDNVVRQAITAVSEFRAARRNRNSKDSTRYDPPQNNSTPMDAPTPVQSSATGSQTTTPAVIVGLDCYTGLQTARIFHDRQIPVIGVAENVRHFACRTRACRQVIGSPTRTLDLIRNLEQLGARLGSRAVLIPCIDMSVLLIAQHRERLDKYFHIALPEHACVETLLDKSSFYAFAERNGFPVPRSYNITNLEEALVAAEQLNFPCILKPAVKTDLWEKTVKTKVFQVQSTRELVEVLRRAFDAAPIFTLQEWIEGGDDDLFTCNCYFGKSGEPLVTFMSRKLRQWPPHVGVASLGQECRNDNLRSLATELFRAASFQGLGYLEVKRDRRTGKHYCIEANVGRPTGRSAMAEVAGVELLQTMYCDLLDLPLPAARKQQYRDTKWIYFRKDIRAAFYYWRRGELSIRQWLKSLRGNKANAVFSWHDPWPSLIELFSAARKKRKTAGRKKPLAATQLVRSRVSQP